MVNGIAVLSSTTARPLGSASNPNCQIDSMRKAGLFSPVPEMPNARIWQWKLLDKRLVRREHALVQLLDPPFDKSNLNPAI